MVSVAQLVERLIVVQVVASSSLVTHPIRKNLSKKSPMKNNSTQPLKGMLDFHPQVMQVENFILNKMHQVAKEFNFKEYDSPIMEPLEVFATKSSNEILNEQAYLFSDKGNRQVILKPEITPALARLVAQYQNDYPLPLKWYTIGKCFRYENPQRGRLREFKQVNFDIIGEDHYLYDYLILQLVLKLLQAFAIKSEHYHFFFNHRGLVDSLLEYLEFSSFEKSQFYYLVDRKNKMSKEEYAQEVEKKFQNSKKIDFIYYYLQVKNPLDFYDKFSIAKDENFLQLLDLIHNQKMPITFSPEIVRGFDYYTGLVFEVFAATENIKRSLLGGGRYNNLIGHYSKSSLTGIGLGLGVYIFNLFLKELKIIPEEKLEPIIDYYLAPLSEEAIFYSLDIIQNLKKKESSLTFDIGLPKNIKQHFKKANKLKIKNIIFIGEDEIKNQTYTIKKL